MSKTMDTGSDVDQPRGHRAESTTNWGKVPPVPEIRQFLQGPQRRSVELGRALGIFFEIMGSFASFISSAHVSRCLAPRVSRKITCITGSPARSASSWLSPASR